MRISLSIAGPPPRPSLIGRILKAELFHQMAKFMSVGVVSVCLSAVIFHFSSEYFRHSIPTPQLRLFAANGIAFAITVTTAFLMNSRITFREHGAGLPEYVRYGIVNLVGFCLNTLLLIGFSQLIALVRRQTLNEMLDTFRLGKMMAWAGAVGCVFFWNFFMSRDRKSTRLN